MSAITLVLDLKDNLTAPLLRAAHAAKSLADQSRAIEGLQDELRRVGREAERVRIGPEQFAIQEAIADLDRLEAQLRATNSATDSALSTITTRRAQLTSRGADRTSKSLDTMGDSAHRLSEHAGDMDSSLVAVSGVLDLVNPKLGESVRVVADMGAGIEGLIRAIRGSLPVLAAMAAAAAIGAAIYSRWSKEQKRLTAETERSSALLDAHRDLVINLRDASLDYMVVLGDMTEAEREIMRVRQDSFVSTLPRLQGLTTAITDQGEVVRLAEEEMNEWLAIVERSKGQGTLVATETAEMVDAIHKYNAAIMRAISLDEDRDLLLTRSRELMGIRISQIEKEQAVTTGAAAALDAYTNSLDYHNRVAAAAASEMGVLSSRLDALSGRIETLLPSQSVEGIDRLDMAAQMIAQLSAQMVAAQQEAATLQSHFDLLSRGLEPEAAEEYQQQIAKFLSDANDLEGLIDVFRDRLDAEVVDFMGSEVELPIVPRMDTEQYVQDLTRANRVAALEYASDMVGVAGQLASSPMTVVAQMGPIGAIVAAVVAILQQIGQRDPTTGKLAIQERAKSFVLAIEAGIEALPEVLSKVGPDFVQLLIRKLVPALLKVGYELITDLPEIMIRDALREIERYIQQVIPDLIQQMKEAWREFWNSIKPSTLSEGGQETKFGNVIVNVFDPEGAAVKGQVDRQSRSRAARFNDPLTRILMRPGSSPRGEAMGSGGSSGSGGVVVNISGSLVDRNVIDRLGRDLNRQFGSYGRATQPIFQGG